MSNVGPQGEPANYLDWLVSQTTAAADSPSGPSGFAVLEPGQTYHAGTTVPLPQMSFLANGSAALAVPPNSVPSPTDYMGVYVTLREYGPIAVGTDEEILAGIALFGRQLIAATGPDEMTQQLCVLVAVINRPQAIAELNTLLEQTLSADSQARLRAYLSPGQRHVLLARQPILVALLRALLDDGNAPVLAGSPQIRPDVSAMILSHAVGTSLNWGEPQEGEPRIGGFPEHIAVDLVCNQTLYSSDDMVSVLDRTSRLWRDFGHHGAPEIGGRDPAALLETITGLEVEDFVALGFALYAHRAAWVPGQPMRLMDDFGCDMEPAKKTAFLEIVARTPEALKEALQVSPPRSDWDLLALMTTPVLHYPGIAPGELGGLLVIDLEFLIDRVTAGLYWLVHDRLKAEEGEQSRRAWTQAWGAMVEAMVEEELRPHAPAMLGAGSTFFTEEDLGRAYPGRKTADVVIDGGSALVALEIVSGRPSTNTVLNGSPNALRADLERIVFKKVRQLDDSVKCLLENPDALLGSVESSRPIQPVVVAAGGFAMSPVTAGAINEYCREHDLLSHPRVRSLAVITIDEIEMLEGLRESRSIALPEVLHEWKNSSLADVSLRNFLLVHFGNGMLIYRPARMHPRFDRFTDDIVLRLRIRDDPGRIDDATSAT